MSNAPDDLIVTGPNFEQDPIGSALVTPTGGVQMTLSRALAFGANLTMPGPIGSVAPNTGAFTTLQANTFQSASGASQIVIRNGPNGNIIATTGGSGNDLAMRGNITLPGGVFGGSDGHLFSGVAPIFQNAAFTGSTSNPAAAFGAFLQQSDNSTNTGAGVGFFEHLILNGSLVVGGRTAGQFNLDINQTTGNPSQIQYVGLGSKCNLNATDGGGTSSAFGSNPVASIGPGVTAAQCVGTEINTWIQTGAIVNDRIGLQVVDVLGSTYGVQASRDDMGYVVTNQYAPSTTLGFKIGLSFGRAGGFFPVATNGTLIGGQGNLGASWSVANGIDWTLGTATGDWLKFGSVFSVDGLGSTHTKSLVMPLTTPASSSAAGVTGTVVVDAGFLYVCTAANTWKRAALSTF